MKDITEENVRMIAFGEAVRGARKKAGIKANDLAKMIGVSEGTMANIEKGKVRASLENAIRIAEILGVPLDVLLQDVYSPSVSAAQSTSVLWAEYNRVIEQLYETAGNAAIEAALEKSMVMVIEKHAKKNRTKKHKKVLQTQTI